MKENVDFRKFLDLGIRIQPKYPNLDLQLCTKYLIKVIGILPEHDVPHGDAGQSVRQEQRYPLQYQHNIHTDHRQVTRKPALRWKTFNTNVTIP